jgi:hypothetical protein
MGLFSQQIYDAKIDKLEDVTLYKGNYTFRFKGHAHLEEIPKVLQWPIKTELAGKKALLTDARIVDGFSELDIQILENPIALVPLIIYGIISVAVSVGFIVTSDNLVAIFKKTLSLPVLVAGLAGIYMITKVK